MSNTDNYYIRPLTASDLSLYRKMRLEALQTHPGFFGNSHAKEASMPEEQWLERLTNPDRCCFGLYSGNELVGITGIVIEDGKGYLTQSYIREQHRGSGLSRMLYQARINWAKEHGLKQLLVGHRASNVVSKAANQHFGFQFSYTESRNWPDGGIEDMVYYVLEI
ncbi:MAG TPA: GNAT family N-acetyltransferase [Flavipsychrobacter sp.]|nr:GNAT family N-acetyltransferase [Flavipsychrobacter sp.]